ncbi:hypothetical protein KP005_11955 [Geomonas nitrogeniifigens]|uniref:HNH endonuclease n=1 Tax=Geomonas diazotrophica TaxID=2843197 RepID=A0ABX8JCF4_9BACT|nr:hypothetical protein [Geomonas nitrogeniifigens]QWV96094.1 hypothetical protein KP005_11955 [Geomonas nitrogeniifigens]
MNFIIQPAGGEAASSHYAKTILNPIKISDIAAHLSRSDLNKLAELHPDGVVYIWGVTRKGSNPSRWGNFVPNSVALFTGRNHLLASGVITYSIHNPRLAEDLWGTDDDGYPWEYMYFLKNILPQNIHYVELRQILGLSEVYPFRRCEVISRDNPMILEKLSLQETIDEDEDEDETATEEDYQTAVKELDPSKPLDERTSVLSRKEQSFLRKHLFRKKVTNFCGICGKEYPVELLVAGHIKPRSKCSIDEKLDYKNIVMPVCKMGCDDLYEKGYISISKGKVVSCPDKYYTDALKTYVLKIHNLHCLYHSPSNEKYFLWHETNRLKK